MENLRVKFIPVDIILAENLVSAPISKKDRCLLALSTMTSVKEVLPSAPIWETSILG